MPVRNNFGGENYEEKNRESGCGDPLKFERRSELRPRGSKMGPLRRTRGRGVLKIRSEGIRMVAVRRCSIGPSSPAQLAIVRAIVRSRRPLASAYCFHSGSGACPSIRGADLAARSARVRADARRCAASSSVGVTMHVHHAGVDPVRTRHDATRSGSYD